MCCAPLIKPPTRIGALYVLLYTQANCEQSQQEEEEAERRERRHSLFPEQVIKRKDLIVFIEELDNGTVTSTKRFHIFSFLSTK